MVPRFADYWKEQTGHYPARLLFDSRATIYAGLSQLTQRKVGFITIRRRGSGMLTRVGQLPADRWRHCQITQAKGKHRQVQYVDEWVKLDGYEGAVRQLIVTGLGHESPTFFLTNDQPPDLLYRKMAERLKGFVRAGPPRLFRKFVDTSGTIEITRKEIVVHLSKRAHNPLLKEAGLTAPTRPVPWLEGHPVRLACP